MRPSMQWAGNEETKDGILTINLGSEAYTIPMNSFPEAQRLWAFIQTSYDLGYLEALGAVRHNFSTTLTRLENPLYD